MEIFNQREWKGGLNNSDEPTKIADNELAAAKNIIIKKDGNIKRRHGYERVYQSTDQTPDKSLPATSIQNIYQFTLNNEWWLLVIAGGKVYKWNTLDKIWENISDNLVFNNDRKLGLLVYYGDILVIDKQNGIYIYKNEVTFLDDVLYSVKDEHIYVMGDSNFNNGTAIDIEISDSSDNLIGKTLYQATNDVRLKGIYRYKNNIYLLDNLTRWRIIKLNLLFEYQTEIDITINSDVVPRLVFWNDGIYVLNTTTTFSRYNIDTLTKEFTRTLTKSTNIIERSKKYNALFMPVGDINGIFSGLTPFNFSGMRLYDFDINVVWPHAGTSHIYSSYIQIRLKYGGNIIARKDFAHWRESGRSICGWSGNKSVNTSVSCNGGLVLEVYGHAVYSAISSYEDWMSLRDLTLKFQDLQTGAIYNFSKSGEMAFIGSNLHRIGQGSGGENGSCCCRGYTYENGHRAVSNRLYIYEDSSGDFDHFYDTCGHFFLANAARRLWDVNGNIFCPHGQELYDRADAAIWSTEIHFQAITLPSNLQYYLFRNNDSYIGYRYGNNKEQIQNMAIRKNGNSEYATFLRGQLKIDEISNSNIHIDINSATISHPERKFINSPDDDGIYMYFLSNVNNSPKLKKLNIFTGAQSDYPYIIDLNKFNGGTSDLNDIGTAIFGIYFEKKKHFRFLGAPDKSAYEVQAGGGISGDIEYIITYIFEGNVESLASNALRIENLSNNKVRLFNMFIPEWIQNELSQDPNYLIERRIYRKDLSSANPEFILIDTIDNNTTEFVDDGQTSLNTVYTEKSKENYLFDVGKIYLNRLILMGNDKYDSMIFYSAVDVINDVPLSNWREINKNDGDTITAIEPLQGQLLIFKTNNIYSIIGDVEDGGLNHISKNIGCVHQNTVASLKAITFFLDRSGFYMTDGNQVIKLSEKISKFFENDYEEKINLKYIYNARVVIDNFANEVKWFLPTGYREENNVQIEIDYINKVLIYNYEMKLWRGEFYGHTPTEAAIIEEDDNKLPAVVFGGTNGRLYKFTKANDDNGMPIAWEVITKAFAMNSNLYEKIFKKLFVVYNAQESFDIGYSVSLLEFHNETAEAYGKLYNKNKIIRIMNGRGTEIQVRFTGNDFSEPIEIKELQIYYLPLRATGRGR